jgi:hypothetical protein
MPINAWMTRQLQDYALRFRNPGLPVYLRKKWVVDDALPYVTLGFTITGAQYQSGVHDILIAPPPDVLAMGTRNTGLDGANLPFGPKRFIISHTFVLKQMALNNYTYPYDVFRAPDVVGLYYGNRLWAIDSLQDLADGGEIIAWEVKASANELEVQRGTP